MNMLQNMIDLRKIKKPNGYTTVARNWKNKIRSLCYNIQEDQVTNTKQINYKEILYDDMIGFVTHMLGNVELSEDELYLERCGINMSKSAPQYGKLFYNKRTGECKLYTVNFGIFTWTKKINW